jgi:tripeptide aminopeptidase
MITQENILKRFFRYVSTSSESGDEKEFYELLISELNKMGAEVYVDNAGTDNQSNANNIYATFNGSLSKKPLVFSCHMDTVTPGKGIEPIIDGDMVKSKGDTILASDDKSGIAALLEAMSEIIENKLDYGKVQFIFTISEETGLKGSKALDYTKIVGNECFVLDSSGSVGKIVTNAPAQNKITAHITGKTAHAGLAPEKGVSAIMIGAEAISKMKLLRIDEETTANIGIFESVGATNIVSGKAKLVGEVRSLKKEKIDKQTSHMQNCLEEAAEKFGGKVDIKVDWMYESFNIDENEPIVAFVKEHCLSLGIEPFTTSTGGGSDANIYNANGIKSLNLGCGVNNAHSTEENIKIDDLVNLTKLVYSMITH